MFKHETAVPDNKVMQDRVFGLVFTLCITFFLLTSIPGLCASIEMTNPYPFALYTRPVDVDVYPWETLSPYFLPEDSKEKAILDSIFTKKRVTKSIKAARSAGFLIITDPKDKIIVLKHPELKGYLVKLYLDTMETNEWDCWLRRARGANVIRDAIQLHGFQHLMKVPRKWVYPLPEDLETRKVGNYKKHFVLLVEEMDILNRKKNRKAFKTKMTPELLVALYIMLTQYQLIDSVYADNIPFCKDGRIAFVDTEWTGDSSRPVPLTSVGQYLNSDRLTQWEQLIVNGL